MCEATTTLTQVCEALLDGDCARAGIAARSFPRRRITGQGRKYTLQDLTMLFFRDGFIDRYTGERVVFPGTLRLISLLMPDEFPFHPNWKVSECHPMYWTLFPTLDHVIPVALGGADEMSNWVTTSMLRNSAKANWTLEELGWRLLPPGNLADWSGLTIWFSEYVQKNPEVLRVAYVKRWHATLSGPSQSLKPTSNTPRASAWITPAVGAAHH